MALTQWQSAILVNHPSSPELGPNLLTPPQPCLPTPIKVERLSFLLDMYLPYTANFLLPGFTHGFPLHFDGERTSFTSNNLKSALLNPTVVDAKLHKRLELNRLPGPFESPPFSTFRVSPLGVVPKKAPGDFRLINHLSFPRGSSVNEGITSEHTSVQYATIDHAIQLIKIAGRGSFMAKTDRKKNDFWIIPISPGDYGLLGMQ